MKQAVDFVQWRLRGGGIQGSIQRTKAVRGIEAMQSTCIVQKTEAVRKAVPVQ
jgi:hypothetical protein